MSGASSRQPQPPDPGTLGSLLYADRSRPRVAEHEWVDLVRRIADRDERALRALYDRTNRIVFTLILRLTDDRETAQELTLDVFHDLWRRAATYDASGGTVLGWIMNQARSRAIDSVRYATRKKRVAPAVSETDSPIPGPHEQFAAGQKARLLRAALEALTPDERTTIEIAYFSELTYAEAATELSQPLGTVKTRIRSGLDKLRRTLAAQGIAE